MTNQEALINIETNAFDVQGNNDMITMSNDPLARILVMSSMVRTTAPTLIYMEASSAIQSFARV